MALGIVSILHVVTGVLALIELGLTAYCVSRFSGWLYNYSPDRLNFMLFNSIWSLLVLAYVGLTPLYMTRAFHKFASVGLEAITMLFWFAGSIALAVLIGVPQCHGDGFCGALQASVAFGFFLWVAFAALTALDTIEAMRSRKDNTLQNPNHHHTSAHEPGKPSHHHHAYPGA